VCTCIGDLADRSDRRCPSSHRPFTTRPTHHQPSHPAPLPSLPSRAAISLKFYSLTYPSTLQATLPSRGDVVSTLICQFNPLQTLD
jgi:hypothetical protein